MAKSFLTSIQLNGNSLLNGKIDARWASTPSGTTNPDGTGTATAGQISSYNGALYVYSGTAWNLLSTSSGTVTSVSGTTNQISSTGGTTPVLSLATAFGDTVNPYASKTANYVLAAPNGSNGVPSFRAIVAADIPTLNQNTTGSAGSVANTLTFGTGLTAGGSSFNGSAAITITPVSATTLVAGIVQLSDSTSTTGSTKAATETAVKAAYDRGSTGVTNAATAQTTADAALPKAGGTMSGAIAMGGSKITNLGTPTADADAATKLYVDTVAAGINVHEAVNYATTGALGTTGNLVAGAVTTTYANGTSGLGATITLAVTGGVWTSITIDGQSLTAGQRVLIKDQASALQNGIYTVTTAPTNGGTGSAVFTRAVDNDQSPEIDAGDLTYVIAGTTNGGDGWVQTVANIVVGTTGVVWTQFSGSGAVPYASTTVAGIASFDTNTFTVGATGAVSVKSAGISVGQGGTGASTLTGVLKGNGTSAITAATAGTDYLAPPSGTALLKANSGGALANATAGTDYLAPPSGTALLKANSGGALANAVAGTDYVVPSGTVAKATNVVGGVLGSVPYQSAADTTLFVAPNTSATKNFLSQTGTGSAGALPAWGALAYADLPTNVGVVARKVSLVGTGSGTTIALTHGLGTNLLTAQVYDTSTSTATLVEVDITVTSTVATATFASTTTLSNYTLVVVG